MLSASCRGHGRATRQCWGGFRARRRARRGLRDRRPSQRLPRRAFGIDRGFARFATAHRGRNVPCDRPPGHRGRGAVLGPGARSPWFLSLVHLYERLPSSRRRAARPGPRGVYDGERRGPTRRSAIWCAGSTRSATRGAPPSPLRRRPRESPASTRGSARLFITTALCSSASSSPGRDARRGCHARRAACDLAPRPRASSLGVLGRRRRREPRALLAGRGRSRRGLRRTCSLTPTSERPPIL